MGVSPSPLPFLLLALTALSASCGCDRGLGLSQKSADVVLVTHAHGLEAEAREATQELDPVPMGRQGATTVKVRNLGRARGTLAHLAQVSGSEAFSLELPGQVELGPGADVELGLTFAAPQAADATLGEVLHEATFSLRFDGTAPGEEVLTLRVRAVAVATDCFVPARLDFGAAPRGVAVALPLVLDNAGALPTRAEVEAPTGPDASVFAVTPLGAVAVEAGARARIPVTFTPTELRRYEARLGVRRASACPRAEVLLSGAGSDEALSWAPTLVDFGRLPVGQTAVRSVRVVSGLQGSLSVSSVSVTGAGITVTQAPVEVRGSAEFILACTPDSLGPRTGALTFDLGTQPPTRALVPLRCQGGGPRLRVLPEHLELGLIPLAAPGLPPVPVVRTLHVQNVGTPPIPGDPGANLFLGRGGLPPFFSVLPRDSHAAAASFVVGVPPTYDEAVGVPAQAGVNEVPLTVTVTPAQPGPFSADLVLYSNDGVSPETVVQVSGTAETMGRCTVGLLPRVLEFGTLPPGIRQTRQLSISNDNAAGGPPCLVTGFEVLGHEGIFSVPGAPRTGVKLAAGTSLVLDVVAAIPPGAAPGTGWLSTLAFSTSSAATPRVLVPLSASVADCLVAVPSALEFGVVQPGCRSPERAVNLYNLCSTTIPLQSVWAQGAGYAVTAMPHIPDGGLPLWPGQAPLTVSVAFAPQGEGRSEGRLALRSGTGRQGSTLYVPLGGAGVDGGQQEDVFDLPAVPQVDLLVTVDNSCSMADKQQALADNFASFISVADQARVDLQLGVTTTDDTPQGARGRLLEAPGSPAVLTSATPNLTAHFAQKVAVGTSGAGLEQPLSTSLRAVTPPLTTTSNAGLVRPAATLAVVVVSDAVDQSPEPAAYYLGRLLGAKGPNEGWRVSFSTIGPFSTPTPSGCTYDSVADPGRYRELVDATHGEWGDICTSDWARDLDRIARGTFAAPTRFPLKGTPAPGAPLRVTINGRPVSGWRYDAATNTVEFTPGSGPAAGTQVSVSYQAACY